MTSIVITPFDNEHAEEYKAFIENEIDNADFAVDMPACVELLDVRELQRSSGEVHTIAVFATALAEALLSVAEQNDVNVSGMTFAIDDDPESMSVPQAIAMFKEKLRMTGKGIAERVEK